ncbi:Fe-S cluster assembly ATPase SufC [Negativicoccus succinicivorans]|uniref:Fe-S cluster assembly ATPase SufC n=1 Tax=Negativicoccus succinicivorans TaxID=620903 RepID=UPI002904855C|nr:Fe-S cluster assembly ATPase SufC [Negativicoccus succinicivorans]MDU2417500.1 Fe-S cluster assembly ATPase SufC [Negativicoccus succinicivorans]
MSELLRIEDLHVAVEDKELLHGVNLTVEHGEVHVVMGTNGAGKSTLMHAIMGNPAYTVTQGKIYFEGKDITDYSVDERAKTGIFLSFQSPLAVPGITVENFLRTAKVTVSGEPQRLFPFKRKLHQEMRSLDMDIAYADRYVNDGFSGGERKKSEILQMKMLEPKLAILDETDSGLDVDAVRIVSQAIADYHSSEHAFIIITHHNQLLKYITPDKVHVMMNGNFVTEGDASLIDMIEAQGFDHLRNR